MDSRRFDALARLFSSPGSRRHALATLISGALGLGGIASGASDRVSARKKQKKNKRKGREVSAEGPCGDGSGRANRCRKDRDCCTRHCDKRKGRCRCLKPGQACARDQHCCPGRTGRTCQNGTCTPRSTCGDVCARGCQFSSLQAAIDAAAADAIIRLCAETYPGSITIPGGKSLTLQGAGDEANGTVLDGQGADRVVNVEAGATAVFAGLRITGGNSSGGGGIGNRGALTLTDCTVTGNTTTGSGGGIFNTAGGRLTLTNCGVISNRAGIAGGGIISNSGTVTLIDSTVEGNTAGGQAGGLFAGSELSLSGCTVADNAAADVGGGIVNFGAVVTLTNSAVTNNVGLHGGGICNFVIGGEVTLNGCTVTANRAIDSGGGIFNSTPNATVTLTDTTVSGNTAGNDGGGILNVTRGTVTLDGASQVCDNEPNQCVGFSAPSGVCTEECPA